MPRTGLSPDELRDKALEVALRMIRAQGADKVRLAAVAKEIGVSHAALYAYFKDKEALLDEATIRWLAHLETVAEAHLTRFADAETRLREWFVVRYVEKRQRALQDPQPYLAYSLAASTRRTFLLAHEAATLARVTLLVSEAGLGDEAQARLVLDATMAFSHPVLIIALAQQDRTADLVRLLDVVIAGLRTA